MVSEPNRFNLSLVFLMKSFYWIVAIHINFNRPVIDL